MLEKLIVLILIISFFSAIFLWILIRGGSRRSDAYTDERIDLNQQNFHKTTNDQKYRRMNPKTANQITDEYQEFLSIRY